jgi:CRISPR-associated endonuclease/helicase Cas3
MAELSAQRFAEFFKALWGYPPFAWQSALAARVMTDSSASWPQAIALPTAAGKTACMDVAVYALAASLQRRGSVVRCAAPRRIFFVVDRRIIVDEAHERALELGRKLAGATDGILKEVADALRQIAYGRDEGWEEEAPLLAFQLRGGMYRSEAWARSPLQPIVVASTVDQVGSRLLFRAYGRGPGMWPVFAGLVANDSLIFLDEAHCAKPFLETLQAVARFRKLASKPLFTCFHSVVLSATPPGGIEDVFEDKSSEPRNPDHPLGRRQLAQKPARLIDPVPAKSAGKSSDAFARALAEQAEKLADNGLKAIVIFANRVATARAAHELLEARKRDAVLLTGRMRTFDKDDVVQDRLLPLAAKNSEARVLDRPIFVIATQTLEVGADLDFDGLVTECASLDALRQRFGRLNRKGRQIQARAAILIRQEQSANSDDDPVYGGALARTWAWLNTHAAGSEIDLGISSLAAKLPQGEALEQLNAPSLHAPVLLPAHLDFLAQTSPRPKPSPEVSLFLHGPARASADVQVCWRADLAIDEDAGGEKALDALSHCPPASAECLPVPIWQFQKWMKGEVASDTSADIEGEVLRDPDSDRQNPVTRPVIRWPSRDKAQVTSDPDDIHPGDVIVIPAGQGADWRVLGDLARFQQGGESEPGTVVLDWGDRSFRASRARALLRLHPNLVDGWPVSADLKTAFGDILTGAEQQLDEDPETLTADLKELLKTLAKENVPDSWRWLPEVAASLAGDRKLSRNLIAHPFGGLILRGSRRLQVTSQEVDLFTDEDDASASGTVPVPLSEHLPGVAEFAKRYAEGSGLDQEFVGAIELAGRLHDLGKADPRFQALLRNGQRYTAGDLLAKSGDIPKGRASFERVRRAADYPEGGRHELLSVRLAENADDRLPSDASLRELVLHLIASHHGYCRPFAPVIEDERPVGVDFEMFGRNWSAVSATQLERLDSGVSTRFWSLINRHGWWGLAWLESLLRLADHRRSEFEQTDQERRNG